MDQPSATATADVTWAPAWIRSGAQHLAGWIHRPRDASRLNGRGLLICKPFGHELIHAHQAIREMANSFAREGYCVLRFDYTGTGDSEADEFMAGIVATWSDDILAAADYLRQSCGTEVRQVLGVRSGALLAAACATRLGCPDGLILWDPVPSGRRLIRELRANEKLAYFRCAPELLESAGFPYPDGMLEDLARLDIAASLDEFDGPVAAFVRDNAPVPAAISRMGAGKSDVGQFQVAGLASMLLEPHHAVIPWDVIEQAVAWASSRLQPQERIDPAIPADTSNEIVFDGAHDGIVETVLRVSESGGTGILCRSEDAVAGRQPIVLFGNSGSIYHIGPNRLYVTLARRLAREGFSSFRYDLPNIGDGLQATHPEANYAYPKDAVARITEVIDFAVERLGYPAVILTGVCSGATQAFLAALAQRQTTALVETVMVNPKVFYVEDVVEFGSNYVMQRANYYGGAVGDPDRWRRLLTGRIDYGQLVRFLLRRSWQLAGKLFRRSGRLIGLGPGTRLGRDLVHYMNTGRRLSFFFSSRDPGHRILLESSDGVAAELIREGKLPVAIIEDADHTMIAKRCREEFVEKFVSHLRTNYPSR